MKESRANPCGIIAEVGDVAACQALASWLKWKPQDCLTSEAVRQKRVKFFCTVFFGALLKLGADKLVNKLGTCDDDPFSDEKKREGESCTHDYECAGQRAGHDMDLVCSNETYGAKHYCCPGEVPGESSATYRGWDGMRWCKYKCVDVGSEPAKCLAAPAVKGCYTTYESRDCSIQLDGLGVASCNSLGKDACAQPTQMDVRSGRTLQCCTWGGKSLSWKNIRRVEPERLL